MTLERKTLVVPAYDKRPKKPGEPNYGIHSAELSFVVLGPKGAVALEIDTGWQLPHVHTELWLKGHYSSEFRGGPLFRSPDHAFLGLHRNAELSDHGNCQKCGYTPSGFCVSEGSGLRGSEMANKLVVEGTQWLWPELERLYEEEL